MPHSPREARRDGPLFIGTRSPIMGDFRAPASKPETQRAMIMGALGSGSTIVRHPLHARETAVMIEACRAIGAEIEVGTDRLEIEGIAGRRRSPGTRWIWASGSALVARLFTVIGSTMPEPVIVDGNSVLRGRPFEPLLRALEETGVELDYPDAAHRLPCVARSTSLPGGTYRLATSVSSQFVTALLVPAPMAAAPVRIVLEGPSYSLSYIRQTLEMMERFGVPVRAADDLREIEVPNGIRYAGQDVSLTGDFTSASYLLGAAFVTRGHVIVGNLDPASAQGERAIVDILAAMGAKARWYAGEHTLELDCTSLPAEIEAAFDLSDCPNILPTVAAVAATIPGRVRLTGARLTQNHKSRRIDAMAEELGKAGVSVVTLHDAEGMVDGLEIRGRRSHGGAAHFSSHGDHRIFMSMVLFSLACERPCSFEDGHDTADSYPEFAHELGLGSHTRKVMRDERLLVAS